MDSIHQVLRFLQGELCMMRQVYNPATNDPWFHMFCKWIHEYNWLNSRVSIRLIHWTLRTNLLRRHVFTVKSRVFHVMTHASETIPVLTQYDLCQTRDYRQNTCIRVNTHENTYWWSGTNYEPVWHVPTVRNGSLFAGNSWVLQTTSSNDIPSLADVTFYSYIVVLNL